MKWKNNNYNLPPPPYWPCSADQCSLQKVGCCCVCDNIYNTVKKTSKETNYNRVQFQLFAFVVGPQCAYRNGLNNRVMQHVLVSKCSWNKGVYEIVCSGLWNLCSKEAYTTNVLKLDLVAQTQQSDYLIRSNKSPRLL